MKNKIKQIFTISCIFQIIFFTNLFSQKNEIKTYSNPILHEDFSDPDVIKVGDYFYMTASSFISIPGLPILMSKDLVNWKLVSYAINKLPASNYYNKVQHGAGVWAPSIRYHKNEFYIYFPDPEFGIYMIKSKNVISGWSKPVLVLAGKGLIDPCPLWDDNGKVYLVHAFAGSRAGIKSILMMKELNAAGDEVIDQGKIIYDGHDLDPTIEGPKIYKKFGWYYIFAPAGGVQTGWQTVLRSKNIYGPYERKKVMEQGTSTINGPHQGAWVQTNTGEDWFIHFQDKGAYGRITHLQPMIWKNEWPIIGLDKNNDGIGEPVLEYRIPQINKNTINKDAIENKILQDVNPFQWNANPETKWSMPYLNNERHYAVYYNDSANNLWHFPAMYLRKLNKEKCTITTKINFNCLQIGERAGFILFGKSYASIELKNTENGLDLNYIQCLNADKGDKEEVIKLRSNLPHTMFFKATIESGAIANLSYSIDGVNYYKIENSFALAQGVWVGTKIGFYCKSNSITNDAGFMEIKSFEIENNIVN